MIFLKVRAYEEVDCERAKVGAGNHELAFERAKRLVYLCSAIISIACLTLLFQRELRLHWRNH